jgi:hypothetical protein
VQLKLHIHAIPTISHYNSYRHNTEEPILNRPQAASRQAPNITKNNNYKQACLVDALTIHDCLRRDGEWAARLGQTEEIHCLDTPAIAYIAPEKVSLDQWKHWRTTKPCHHVSTHDALNRVTPPKRRHRWSSKGLRLSPGDNPSEGEMPTHHCDASKEETTPTGAIVASTSRSYARFSSNRRAPPTHLIGIRLSNT